MCTLSIGNSSFPNLFQITELQKNHIASAGVAIEKLFNNPDVETVELICEARQSYKSKWTSYSRFILKYVAFLTYCGLYPSMTAWVHISYLYFFRLASWWKTSWSCGTSQFQCEQSSGGNFGCPVCPKTSRNITGALVLIRCHHSPWGRCTILSAWGNYYLFYVGITYLILYISPLKNLYHEYCF